MGAAGTYYDVGDITGNGAQDIIASNGGDITVRYGNGDGTYSATTTLFNVGVNANVYLGDITGNGVADMVLLGRGVDYALIYVNDGTGNFTHSQTISGLLTGSQQHATFGDVDGDGINDLVFRKGTVGGTIYHYRSNGDGTLSFVDSFGSNRGAEHIQLADLNNNGRSDLIYVSLPSSTMELLVNWRLSDGSGSFGVLGHDPEVRKSLS